MMTVYVWLSGRETPLQELNVNLTSQQLIDLVQNKEFCGNYRSLNTGDMSTMSPMSFPRYVMRVNGCWWRFGGPTPKWPLILPDFKVQGF